jgi:hypothetical protein
VTAKLRIPLDGRAAGTRTLLACADATAKVAERSEKDNCAVAGTITFPVVNAADLVAADRAAGRIDDEQAWALGVLTQAGSPEAMPDRYRGATVADRPDEATAMILDAARRMPTLEPKTQRLLAPLFLPPTARIVGAPAPAPAAGKAAVARAARKAKPKPPKRGGGAGGGSTPPVTRPRYDPKSADSCMPGVDAIVNSFSGWSSVTAKSSKVVFWYPAGDKARAKTAQTFAAAMDSRIWPTLTGLMGKTPRPDGNLDCGHGNSPGLDIYLVPGSGQGSTTPYSCLHGQANSAIVRIYDSDVTTLAHEFFHVLQQAFPDADSCSRPAWIDEGTADWAGEAVYPGTLQNTSASWLESFKPDLRSRAYDAWPFWHSVTHAGGAPLIKAVFEQFANASLTRTQAVDKGIGEFEKRWPQFARDAYNMDPVKSFATWPVLTNLHPELEKIGQSIALSLAGAHSKDVPYANGAQLDALTRDYTKYTFADDVRKVTFTGAPANPKHKIRLLLHFQDGHWGEEAFEKDLSYCRDKPEQAIDQVVFVASNASIDGKVSASPAMNLQATCGEPHFRVTAARFHTFTTGSTHDKWGQSCDAFDVSGQEDYSGTLAQPVDDPKFMLKPSGGGQSADVFFQVPADGMTELHGCTEDDGAEKQCDTTRSIRKAPGTDLMGFGIDVKPGAQQAKLTWYVQDASIGYFDADDSVCNVYEFYNSVPASLREATVPLDDLKHGEHKFRTNNQTSWTFDQKTGNAAQLSLSWDYEITIQVVDGEGVPIP